MKNSYKIIFLGDTAVGKTMLIYRYICDRFQETEPTIGLDFFSTKKSINGTPVRLQVWDTAGQERYKSIITPYLRDSFLAVIVYAIDDRKSFEQLRFWEAEFRNKSHKEGVNILIVANKRDLNDSQRVIQDSEGEEFAKTIGAQFCTSSALNEVDIKELTASIEGTILRDLEANPELENDSEPLENALNAQVKSRMCC